MDFFPIMSILTGAVPIIIIVVAVAANWSPKQFAQAYANYYLDLYKKRLVLILTTYVEVIFCGCFGLIAIGIIFLNISNNFNAFGIYIIEIIIGIVVAIVGFKVYKQKMEKISKEAPWEKMEKIFEKSKIHPANHPEFGRLNVAIATVGLISTVAIITFFIGMVLINIGAQDLFIDNVKTDTYNSANANFQTGLLYIFLSVVLMVLEYPIIIRRALSEDIITT